MVDLLFTLELPIRDEVEIYRRAVELSRRLPHHLFDTLYHAVALESGVELITADQQYYRKARHLGGVVSLGSL